MKQLYVLISGKRLSGKDTLATALLERLESSDVGDDTLISHLADAIRYEVMAMYPDEITDISQIQDNNSPIKEKFRPELIRIGQERRAEDVDYWCRKVYEDMVEKGVRIVLIPDLRFPNEITFFANQPDAITYTIRLETALPERVRRGWRFEYGKDDDISETALDLSLEDRPWDLYLFDIGFDSVCYFTPQKYMPFDVEHSVNYLANQVFGGLSARLIYEGLLHGTN
jgi:phosphomevalonate kinase